MSKRVNYSRVYKLAMIAPTCFYYQVPLYRALAAHPGIELTVYFCSDEGISGLDVERHFKVPGKWSEEAELLEGYRYKMLRNFIPYGSYLKWPFGLINLGIWNEIRRERPHAVVLMSWMNPTWWLALLACLRFRIPALYLTDSNVDYDRRLPKWKAWPKRLVLSKVLFPATSGFLYCGEANRQLYKYYGVPDEKLVPFAFSWSLNGLLRVSDDLKPQKTMLRTHLGIPEDSFVVLYCGRLSKEKSPMALLEAFCRITRPNKSLIFVGHGPLDRRLRDYVDEKKLEAVYFYGFQDRKAVPNFYAISDVLVLPSQQEATGAVVQEAMCFGLPVVVSDRVGFSKDFVKHGENGFRFPSGDVEALADYLGRIMDLSGEERAKMGAKSLELIRPWASRDLAQLGFQYLDSLYSQKRARLAQ